MSITLENKGEGGGQTPYGHCPYLINIFLLRASLTTIAITTMAITTRQGGSPHLDGVFQRLPQETIIVGNLGKLQSITENLPKSSGLSGAS